MSGGGEEGREKGKEKREGREKLCVCEGGKYSRVWSRSVLLTFPLAPSHPNTFLLTLLPFPPSSSGSV